MSADDQGGAGGREVAYRLFAAEFDDADFSFSESDEERAPNYVVTPTGARVNRMFVVGVLTELEQVSDDVLRARVVDPTGAFVIYAGQYQPDALAFLERTEPPAFVAVTGKARTFQPEDSEQVFTSIRPETISAVDAETRDRWTVQTAAQTLDRVATVAHARSTGLEGAPLETQLVGEGVDQGFAQGIALALDHYDSSPAYLDALRDLSEQAAGVVTGERDEVDALTLSPDAAGHADLAAIESVADALSTGIGIGADVDGPAVSPTPDADVDQESEPATASTSTTAADETSADDTAEATTETATEDVAETTADATSDAESVSATTDTEETSTEPTTEQAAAAVTPGGTSVEESEQEATSEPDAGDDLGDFESDASTTEDVGDFDDSTDSDVGDFEESSTDDDLGDFDDDSADSGVGDFDDAGLGDFDADEDADAEADVEDVDPEEFELDEEERERIEDEFGTDFASGTEVQEPGEADIDAPDPAVEAEADPAADEPAASEPVAEEPVTTAAEPAEPDDAATEDDDAEDDEAEPADDVDLKALAVETMEALNEGDGVAREDIIQSVTDETGADDEAVADAIQDALMDGQCYEPTDGTLKPI